MDTKLMTETARAMVAPGKGLLAADESAGTCKKRFDSIGVECTEENRRAYREMLFTTPGVAQFVSGVILFDETLRQKTKDGASFAEYLRKNGILPGIKVDAGTHDMALHPGEKVTEGLDRLAQRMDEYFKLGARFAKWRAVITIGEGIPSAACLEANAHALARYSAICQEASIVPIVEPEVLLDGDHSAERSESVHQDTLETLFHALERHGVILERRDPQGEHGRLRQGPPEAGGGAGSRGAYVARAQAHRSRGAARRGVPVGGTDRRARHRAPGRDEPHRGRPMAAQLQLQPRAAVGAAQDLARPAANVAAAQKALHHRARMNGLAAKGQWSAEAEKRPAAA